MNAPVDVLERRPEPMHVWASSIATSIRIMKPGALNPYLSERWRKHLAEYGKFNCGPYADRGTYPRFSPNTSRRDSWPPGGGPPGSDVEFMREQLLDAYNIAYGVLEPLLGGNTSRNLDEAAALCSAMNDWQAHDFVDPEPRLRASILVPQDDPDAVGEGDREARRRLAVRADPVRLEDVGAAGAPPLLADLRRRAGEQSVDRAACRRHVRTARRPPAAGRSSTSRTTTSWCTRCRTRRRA